MSLFLNFTDYWYVFYHKNGSLSKICCMYHVMISFGTVDILWLMSSMSHRFHLHLLHDFLFLESVFAVRRERKAHRLWSFAISALFWVIWSERTIESLRNQERAILIACGIEFAHLLHLGSSVSKEYSFSSFVFFFLGGWGGVWLGTFFHRSSQFCTSTRISGFLGFKTEFWYCWLVYSLASSPYSFSFL